MANRKGPKKVVAVTALEYLRRQAGMSRKEICKQLGCSTQLYGHWENGERPPWQYKTVQALEGLFPGEWTIKELLSPIYVASPAMKKP